MASALIFVSLFYLSPATESGSSCQWIFFFFFFLGKRPLNIHVLTVRALNAGNKGRRDLLRTVITLSPPPSPPLPKTRVVGKNGQICDTCSLIGVKDRWDGDGRGALLLKYGVAFFLGHGPVYFVLCNTCSWYSVVYYLVQYPHRLGASPAPP
jgi:hypothetical protein